MATNGTNGHTNGTNGVASPPNLRNVEEIPEEVAGAVTG